MWRRSTRYLTVLVIVACANEVVTPPSAVLGSFGGRGTELIASAESVRVNFVCSFASFRQPIMPESDGRFSLAPVLMPTSSGPAAIALKGTFSDSRIEFDAVSLSAAGDIRESHHIVHRDQPGDYSGMGCLTSQSVSGGLTAGQVPVD
jgi:hypothetical protein